MRVAARTATTIGIGGRLIEGPAEEAGRALERTSGVPGVAAAFVRRAQRAMLRGDVDLLERARTAAGDVARRRRVATRSVVIARADAALALGLRR